MVPPRGWWSILAINLPPVGRGSGDQSGGIQLNRPLVNHHARGWLGCWLTLGEVFVGHGWLSKREDREDRKGEVSYLCVALWDDYSLMDKEGVE